MALTGAAVMENGFDRGLDCARYSARLIGRVPVIRSILSLTVESSPDAMEVYVLTQASTGHPRAAHFSRDK
jgi:hypothetical protein